ncbi:transposase [Pyramidobacter piscolens]|uniref:transposase n=1 Tax=Pyramidobacter piscolens TaxID=638849 RepID=UPI003AB14418
MRGHELIDNEWDRIKDISLPAPNRSTRTSKQNTIHGRVMIWIAGNGAQWRELPESDGTWQAVYARFRLQRQL